MGSDIGVYGLGVMGKNLAFNLADHGFTVAVYNRSKEKTEALLEEKGALSIRGYTDVETFVTHLNPPRRIFMMVQAGRATDDVIQSLLPYLSPGDVLIDGGNAYFHDTERRAKELELRGIHFLGLGISGGETGARFGPSLMPGGSLRAYTSVAPMLEAIAAKYEDKPCVAYLGEGGAGHYVKMVHNGIEYADMQLIAEVYHLLKHSLNASSDSLASIFDDWNQGELASYLIEITARILKVKDPESGEPLVDRILDRAQQKGTGKWTAQEALELGVPLSVITEAVYARALSAMKEDRLRAAGILAPAVLVEGSPEPSFAKEPVPKRDWIETLHEALYAAKIIAYAQGFAQLKTAGEAYGWQLPLRDIASIWRAGCIIRARLLNDIMHVYADPAFQDHLLLAPLFAKRLKETIPHLRRAVRYGVEKGLPLPALAQALSYYDGLRSAYLPANLIQAQRDFFGAHTYERTDRPGSFHTDWETFHP
ncbi:MAG: NADP-dependent phosphogluconate dehydrogenase [Candidatus Carbobacillus altaicus]|nr:NADP-dependent phosphogluconate dehydrogenase [Candidatus Carbobacillus altaicus]